MTRENGQPCREENFLEKLGAKPAFSESSDKEHLQVERGHGAHALTPGSLALPRRELAPDKLLRA